MGSPVDTSAPPSRRAFAQLGIALALLPAVPASLIRTMAATPRAWARSRFTPFRGATFRMTGAGDDVSVVLTDISDLSPVVRPGDEKRFALMFVAPISHSAADGIRTFSRDGFGHIDLFVSPVGRSVMARHYQAIINRR